MRTGTLLWPFLLSWLLFGCDHPLCILEPVPPRNLSTDTLRYSISPEFAGRTVIARWTHTSFSSPLASRTLANRPLGQAFPVSSPQGILVLPAQIDSNFEFYAKFRQYLLDEEGTNADDPLLDTATLLESRHWAMAPLVVTGSDEMARITFAQAAAEAKVSDTAGLNSGMVLLWVRDSLVAEQDRLLSRRKLTGTYRRGWHLLRYLESGRQLQPATLRDTVKFTKEAHNPNLV